VPGTAQSSPTARAAVQWALDEFEVEGTLYQADGKEVTGVEIISDAEREHMLEEAYLRGVKHGAAQVKADADARIASAQGLVARAATKLDELANLAPGVLEENVAALAVIVARQIVAREVSLAPQLVADLVRRALTEFPIEQTVRIRINPLDLSMLTINADKPSALPITGTRDASWLADARVARGGCLVEGRDRIVDGRVDTALERAYRRMGQVDAS
jgi:flagellar assembly protein FliH